MTTSPPTTKPATTTQHVQIAIKASPQQVWEALTDPAMTPAYYFGFEAHYDLRVGAAYSYTVGGADAISGRVLDVQPQHRLTTTFNGHWTPEVAELAESTVTFEIGEPPMPTPGVTLLSVRHEGLPDSPAAAGLETGWVTIVSGLKTVLETGAPLSAPH